MRSHLYSFLWFYCCVCISIGCFIQPSPVYSGWNQEQVARQNIFSSNAIVENSGEIWIAYGNSRLHIAHYDGQTWATEIVDDTADVGSYLSLIVDGDGYPNVIYNDHTNFSLKHAIYDGNSWNITTIVAGDYDDDIGLWPSAVLGDDDRIHLSYFHDGDLYYGLSNGGGWLVQLVDSNGYCGKYTSIALNPAGQPSISYWGDESLRYASLSGAVWQTQTVDTIASGGETGWNTSLQFDSQGNPHISYMELVYTGSIPRDKLRYASHDGNSWQLETIIDSGEHYIYATSPTSLILDNSDVPHILHRDLYVTPAGSSWAIEDIAPNFHSLTNLALDPSGNLHASLYRSTYRLHELRYTRKLNGATTWSDTELVAVHGGESSYVDVALKTDNSPVLLWADSDDYDFYAEKPLGTWNSTRITTAEQTRPALAVDTNGYSHSSYVSTDGYVVYANNLSGQWSVVKTFIDQYVAEYFHTDIALESNNTIHVVYTDNLGQLNHSKSPNGSIWLQTVIDADGHSPQIAVDSNGYCHVIYIQYNDVDGYRLLYAYEDSGGWNNEVIEEKVYNGDLFGDIAMALDTSNVPHLSYIVDDNLMYATKSGATWPKTVVDSQEYDYMKAPSIALDALNRPHISYYEASEKKLKYSWYDGSGWEVGELDNGGRVGKFSTLAIGSDGRPRVGYTRYNGVFYSTFTDPWEKPPAPSGLTANALSSHRIQARWTDNSLNEEGFRIEGRENGGDWYEIGRTSPNVTSFDDIIVAGGVTLQIRVSAFNFLLFSNPSNTASATTPAAQQPSGFSGNSATITHPLLSLGNNEMWFYSGQGALTGYSRLFRGVGVEVINGVNCLKVEIRGNGNNPDPIMDPDWSYVWVAEDTNQNVWLLQIYDAEDDEIIPLYQFGSVLWMNASPAVGDILRYFERDNYLEVIGTNETLSILSTGLGPYSGVLELLGANGIEKEYYAPNAGLVKAGYENKMWWDMHPGTLADGDINGDGQVTLEDLFIGLGILVGADFQPVHHLYRINNEKIDVGKVHTTLIKNGESP